VWYWRATTAKFYENSATYVCVKSNSSWHKVSISYTTQTVGTDRSVTFSQTVTNTHVFNYSVHVFSAILLCCELCQAVQVHRRHTDPLPLYCHCIDITEYTAFQNYTHRQDLKLQLDWEFCRTTVVQGTTDYGYLITALNYSSARYHGLRLPNHGT
jgi:hypothetical protein